MQPPTLAEINVYDSLDERVAVRNFLGKDVSEAETLFRQNGFRYTEDLMWMGPIAFRYYITAAIRYLTSDAANGDYGMVAGLVTTLEFRLEYEEHELAPVAVPLAAICDYVADHQGKFNLTDYYEDCPARLVVLRDKFRAMSS